MTHKKSSLLRLTAVLLLLCVTLSGCGLLTIANIFHTDPIDGADWRTWGIIDAYGVLDRDGVSREVCICVTGVACELYCDEAVQVYIDGAELPVTLPDTYDSLDVALDDLNGDGDSDLQLTVSAAGETMHFTWIYEGDTFAYHEELSDIGSQETAPASEEPTEALP